MTAKGVSKKQYRELKPESPLEDSLSPLVTRGWIAVRHPWRHPIEALRGANMWMRMVQVLKRSRGMRGYEYIISIRPLAIGVQVLWEDRGCEMEFYRCSEHKEIATWSLRSCLTPAMYLEHFTSSDSKTLLRVSGFYFFEDERDLPPDRLMPFPPDRTARGS
jgi:hypothetical protein